MLVTVRYVTTLVLGFLSLLLVNGASAQTIRIGLVKEKIDAAEMKAIQQLLAKDGKIIVTLLSLDALKGSSRLKELTHIWYHRTDTAGFSTTEKQLGVDMQSFVDKGGNLLLSREASPLAHVWGFEKRPLELQTDTVRDEGFGRPLGFHAFKEHPLFTGLQGGVYTSKQKRDHVVRKHGFFGNRLPLNGKVAGIQWTYITFTETAKLLLEYDYGKGKLLVAGAYLYYAGENYNRQHLEKFTQNLIAYTAGHLAGSSANYWDYADTLIHAGNFSVAPMQKLPAEKWKLTNPTLELKKTNAGKDFYDLVGRKILWMGKMNGGIEEIWMHPFMALRDFEIGVQHNGQDTINWLSNIPATVRVTPELLEREYRLGNGILREIQTVSFEDPAGVVHLEVEDPEVATIHIRYATSMRYMWPYSHQASGSLQYQFNSNLNGHIISAQKGSLNTVVVYSQLPEMESIQADKVLNQVKVSCRFSRPLNGVLNVSIAGSNQDYRQAVNIIRLKQRELTNLYEAANQYYSSLLANHLTLETPDMAFNEGYKWALARTDQFLQTTPGIGTALMAGFGTTSRGWNGRHTISGRPGYAWYFGRDGIWSAMAINAYGGFPMVKEMLEALIRYQDITGKIYHELTSSGVAHYDASDASPLFVTLAAHYLKYSGDLAYIRTIWPAIKKAMDFCYTTDTDGDGLIENTNVGHGWIEGGSLFGTHTEFYLAGCWANALESAAYMAQQLKLGAIGDAYARDASTVKKIIDTAFWNESQAFFHTGKMIDGTFMPDPSVLATVPVYLGAVTDQKKINLVNDRLGTPYFSTDWGIRMLADSSRKYRPNSYHAGMVWPLYGGWAALSEFRTGHNKAGYQHILNNLLVYRHWGLGSVEETLNGDMYKPNGVCSHQCWSETMVLQPAIEGMLGLVPDALKNTLQLAPYFPWDWPFAKVRNIRMGTTLVNLDMHRSSQKMSYSLQSNQTVSINFQPRLPFGVKLKQVLLNGRKIDWEIEENAEGISVKCVFPIVKGQNQLELEYEGGVGALPLVGNPTPGDSSKGIYIIREQWEGGKYSAVLQGKPGSEQEIRIYSVVCPTSMNGAILKDFKEDVLTLRVQLPATEKQRYTTKAITLEF